MQISSLGYRTDLALLTASGSTVEDLGTHLLISTDDNPTYHWGNFLLLKDLPVAGGAKEAAGAFDSWFPTARYRSIGIDAVTPLDVDEFEAAGLNKSVDEVLVAETVSTPQRPNTAGGIRPITSDEWDKWVDFAMSLREPHVTAEYLRARARAEQHLVEAGLGHRWAVFVDGRIVSSAAIFEAGEGLARYQSVATRPRYQHQGMASTLIAKMGAAMLTRPTVQRLVLVADPEGPAIGLYRALGFRTVEVQVGLSQVF